MEIVLIAAAVIAVLTVVVLVAFVGRSRSKGPGKPVPGADYAPGVGDDASVETTTPRRSVADAELPDVVGEAAPYLSDTLPPGALQPVPGERGPEVEAPEPTAGRLQRLRERLARSQTTLGRGLLVLLSRDHLDDDAWEEVEDLLLTADVGVGATTDLVAALQTRTRVEGTRSVGELRALLADELVKALDPDADRSLHTEPHPVPDAGPHAVRPAVVLVVGVNGTGKTTTCGKLARVLVADGRTVMLGAADTFRAAAVDQLATWGSRVGVETVRGPENGDPAAVAFDAVRQGTHQGVDTVLVDTAGRLHTKVGLMDELGKVKRVVEKQAPIDETLLVLDATTGQNGLIQAKVFTEVVDVTGIVLTKLDGTAKGGIVIAVQRELGVPVKLVGLGEGADDLAPFNPEDFVDALLGETI